MLLRRFKNNILFILILVLFGSWVKPASTAVSEENPCEVFGNIYFVSESKNAHYVVYVQEEESFADLVIFKEEDFSYADREGHWFITEEIVLADRRIYITDNIAEADFTIAYTETESFAGCDH